MHHKGIYQLRYNLNSVITNFLVHLMYQENSNNKKHGLWPKKKITRIHRKYCRLDFRFVND